MMGAMLLLACSPPTPLEVVADEGELGPFGVARSLFRAGRKTGRTFDVDVHLPTQDGAPTGDNPVVVFVQGGKVERERYHWIAAEVAAGGNIVLSPQYPGDLAILGANRSHAALKRARALDADGDPVLEGTLGDHATLMGHSLGGVISTKQWLRHDDDFIGLVLIASYPADGDTVEDVDLPVLSITGSEDGSASLTDVRAGVRRFPDATLAVVDGMTHYDWTSDTTDEERDAEGATSTRDVTEARDDALVVIDAYLAGESLDGDFAGIDFPERP